VTVPVAAAALPSLDTVPSAPIDPHTTAAPMAHHRRSDRPRTTDIR
jgi:hypothetical protein